jgi:hypothetical protein
MHGEERQGGEFFYEWGMLRVDAKVRCLPTLIASEDVVTFIPTEGLSMDGQENFGREDRKQKKSDGVTSST